MKQSEEEKNLGIYQYCCYTQPIISYLHPLHVGNQLRAAVVEDKLRPEPAVVDTPLEEVDTLLLGVAHPAVDTLLPEEADKPPEEGRHIGVERREHTEAGHQGPWLEEDSLASPFFR